MNPIRVILFAVAAVALFCFATLQMAQAQRNKDDIIIIGGKHHGCGPKLLLKRSKDNGDTLIMNPKCHKKESYGHGYDDHGYDHAHGYDDMARAMASYYGGHGENY